MVTFDLQRVREKGISADIVGYGVEDLQGTIGEVDETTEELVPNFISVDTVSSLPGKRAILPAAVIERIDHDARMVYVDRRHEEIRDAPQSSDDETGRNDGYLTELRRHYGPGGAGYRAPRDSWAEGFSRAFAGERIDKAALRQRALPVKERMRLPETGVRDLLLAADIYIVGFVVLLLLVDVVSSKPAHVSVGDIVTVTLLALFVATIDASAGMGVGTVLSPLLLLLAFPKSQVVPGLVATQALAGPFEGVIHSKFGNVKYSLRPLNKATKTMLLVAVPGATGAAVAVVLTYFALKLPDTFVKTYVAVLLLALAAISATRSLRQRRRDYRPRRLPFFGAVGGVNKGVGGGGYGPVVTLGGVLSGVSEKTSIAIAEMADGFASAAGAIAFVVIFFLGADVDWRLLPWLWLGAFPASVVGPFLVRVIPERILRYFIPILIPVVATILLVYTWGG